MWMWRFEDVPVNPYILSSPRGSNESTSTRNRAECVSELLVAWTCSRCDGVAIGSEAAATLLSTRRLRLWACGLRGQSLVPTLGLSRPTWRLSVLTTRPSLWRHFCGTTMYRARVTALAGAVKIRPKRTSNPILFQNALPTDRRILLSAPQSHTWR